MKVTFHSDLLEAQTGFIARWEEVEGELMMTQANQSNSILTATKINTTSTNYIASPNYPDDYFNEDSKVHNYTNFT